MLGLLFCVVHFNTSTFNYCLPLMLFLIVDVHLRQRWEKAEKVLRGAEEEMSIVLQEASGTSFVDSGNYFELSVLFLYLGFLLWISEQDVVKWMQRETEAAQLSLVKPKPKGMLETIHVNLHSC